ncbi:response regulator [Zobellia galactanivorans]|uniref:response regulator n=1 Tax=Zobellia galactanivorans (strain DSM 12802 / CCUG 47099 / CIP 106680 / NCIMB 13871 / Dsij) TaxID=63186 RepID=UPI0026E118F5|nr:response regulator [Zobellia galactanivorans]MDO6810957.1 response regulator [Zobellia galactanivorans]
MSCKVFHIFLTDDDLEDRQFFEQAINELDIDLVFKSFDNGVELMENLHSDAKLPDFIFLDLNMPLMNGEECLNDIREESKFEEIPVIIYSTFVDEGKLKELQGNGANLFLKKPNSFEQLKTAIKTCLNYLDSKISLQKSPKKFLLKY